MHEHQDTAGCNIRVPIHSDAGVKQLRIRLERLQDIESAMLAWMRGALPPHSRHVLLVGFLVFAAAFLSAWGTHLVSDVTASLIASASAVLASIGVDRLDTSARTHADHLDELLNSYEPLSKEAYRTLQLRVQERGAIAWDILECWLTSERHTIYFDSGWCMPSQSHFLKRKV